MYRPLHCLRSVPTSRCGTFPTPGRLYSKGTTATSTNKVAVYGRRSANQSSVQLMRQQQHRRPLSSTAFKQQQQTLVSSRRRKATLASNHHQHNVHQHSNSNSSFASAQQQQQQAQSSAQQQPYYRLWSRLRQWAPHGWSDILRTPRTLPVPRWITPRHYQITLSEVLGHGSFVLVAISYAVDDFLVLRIMAVAGSVSMLFFTYFHPHGRVLWLPFRWNVLFILTNCWRISKVYWDRYCAENMSQELMDLRKRSFYLMDPVDYYRLMSIAEIKDYQKGDLLAFQGQGVHSVRMVLGSERLRVLRDGKLTYFLEHGNFLCEAGIHAGLLLPGDIESCCAIVADGPVRIIEWNRTEFVHMMELHAGVRRSLKAILSWDIVRKLKSQRALLADNEIDDPEQWTHRRSEQTMHRYAAILAAILRNDMLERFHKEINKYRMIHQIDDQAHKLALERCGWTVEEYELGHKLVDDDDDDDEDKEGGLFRRESVQNHRDWKWYMHDVYLRLFG